MQNLGFIERPVTRPRDDYISVDVTPKNLEVREGGNAEFQCRVSGMSDINIRFFQYILVYLLSRKKKCAKIIFF